MPEPLEYPFMEVLPFLQGLARYGSVSSFSSNLSTYSEAGAGKGDYPITGEVLFGVCYKDGQLLIHVEKARGLAAADKGGFSNPYIKTYLLPDKSQQSKRKTKVMKHTLEPKYSQLLIVSLNAISSLAGICGGDNTFTK